MIQHEDKHCTPAFLDRVQHIIDRVCTDTGKAYEAIFVDVRRKPSASKLTRVRGTKPAK